MKTSNNSPVRQTPALCLDNTILNTNIDSILSIAGDPERLWPHIKTYKSSSLVMRLQARGVRSFKCATASEAKLLGRCGVRNALLSYPVTGGGIEVFASVAARYPNTSFSCLVEDTRRLELIEQSCKQHRVRVGVCIDIDSGQGRTGISSLEKITSLVAGAKDSRYVSFLGFHVYDGQNHQTDLEERSAAVDGCLNLIDTLEALTDPGADEHIIAGGTPTFPLYAARNGLSLSPGTAFLYDAGYDAAYPDLPFTPAAWVLSSVVHTSENTITLDAGTKAIATDPAGSRGRFIDIDVDEVLIHNEEHWVLRLKPGSSSKKPGDTVRIIPTHICPTVNLYNELYLLGADGKLVNRWKIDGRDRVLD